MQRTWLFVAADPDDDRGLEVVWQSFEDRVLLIAGPHDQRQSVVVSLDHLLVFIRQIREAVLALGLSPDGPIAPDNTDASGPGPWYIVEEKP